MNGTAAKRIPSFLEVEQLPPGYFDEPNPYDNAPTRKVKLNALVAYARQQGKDCWTLTKEDVQKFIG